MSTVLIVLLCVLTVAVLTQVVRIYEISNAIKGNESDQVGQPTAKENDAQGKYMFLFMLGLIGTTVASVFIWGDRILPQAASVHGEKTDFLFFLSLGVIGLAYLITQPILFYFSYKYRGNGKRKATYVEHNNKLEVIWTLVPGVVLFVLIGYGLSTWIEIMYPETEEDPIVVELYAKQFGWTARVAGEDNVLGDANVRFIEGANVLGVDKNDPAGLDDRVVSELFLPVNKPITFKFRSQDVIHSAYMPHFRTQMNCVPGAVTSFTITPNKTTEQMRNSEDVIKRVNHVNELRAKKGEDPYEFDYVLLCNKICGSAHYNMQLKITVVEEAEYNNWLKEQKTFAEVL